MQGELPFLLWGRKAGYLLCTHTHPTKGLAWSRLLDMVQGMDLTFSEGVVICKALSLTRGHRPEQEAVVSSPPGVMIRLRDLLVKGESWGETGRRLEPSGRNQMLNFLELAASRSPVYLVRSRLSSPCVLEGELEGGQAALTRRLLSLSAGLWRPEMGARPSRRRRLPADPPIALDALPPELLVQVLSHVPPRALVMRCRQALSPAALALSLASAVRARSLATASSISSTSTPQTSRPSAVARRCAAIPASSSWARSTAMKSRSSRATLLARSSMESLGSFRTTPTARRERCTPRIRLSSTRSASRESGRSTTLCSTSPYGKAHSSPIQAPSRSFSIIMLLLSHVSHVLLCATP